MQHKDENTSSGVEVLREVVEQGGCFPAGTRVITDKGRVPIEDIKVKVGDQVLSKPESGEGELCYKPVVRTISYENKELWDLWYFEIKADTNLSKLHKGKLLQLSRKGKLSVSFATPNHPFWVKGVGWTSLDQLEQGQLIEMQNAGNVALVFMVNPLRKTTHPNIAGSYHIRNILDADLKGFDIDDVEYFDFLKFDETGLCGIVDSDIPSPCYINDQAVHILPDVFCQTVYNFEVADCHTYFITLDELWVHNTSCAETARDLLSKS